MEKWMEKQPRRPLVEGNVKQTDRVLYKDVAWLNFRSGRHKEPQIGYAAVSCFTR